MDDLTDDLLDARIRLALSGLLVDFAPPTRAPSPLRLSGAAPVRRLRSIGTAVGLVALLAGGALIAVSTRGASPSNRAVQPGVTSPTPPPDDIGPAQIGPDGTALYPASVAAQITALNAALDRCLVSHGATKQPVSGESGGATTYVDPGGQAQAACRLEAAASDAYGDSREVRVAGQRRATIRSAYGACLQADPNATDRDNAAASDPATRSACRTLVNGAAPDETLLRALIVAAPEMRKLRFDARFVTLWVGRTTRAGAESAIGFEPTRDAASERVIAIAYVGSFQAPTQGLGKLVAQKTLVLLLDEDGALASSGSQAAGNIYVTDHAFDLAPFSLSSVFAALNPAARTTAPEVLKIANDIRDGVPKQLFDGDVRGEPIVWKLDTKTSVDYYIVSFGGDLLCHFGVTPADSHIRGVGCGQVADIKDGSLPFGWGTPDGTVFLVPDTVAEYTFSAKGKPQGVVAATNNLVQAPAKWDAITVRFTSGDVAPTQTYPGEPG